MKKTDKKRIWRRIFRLILFLCVGILIGYQVYLLNARRVGKNLMPMPFGYGQAVVISGSMSPAFEVGDLLIYQSVEKYKIGDMVAFRDGENDLVTHRIVEMNEEYLVTKGDANPVTDDPIAYTDIYGKVIFIIPKVGNFIVFLQHPISIVFVLLLFLGGLEWNYHQERKKSKIRLEKERIELEKLREELSGEVKD